MKLLPIAFAALLAVFVGAPASTPAAAAPSLAGAAAAAAAERADVVTPAQYRGRRYGPRRSYRRGFRRSRVVCRTRFTPYGPRRVCVRR